MFGKNHHRNGTCPVTETRRISEKDSKIFKDENIKTPVRQVIQSPVREK